MVSEVSNLETSAWQRKSITRSNSEVECKSHSSNPILLVIVERDKSCNTISFVKLSYAIDRVPSVCHPCAVRLPGRSRKFDFFLLLCLSEIANILVTQ